MNKKHIAEKLSKKLSEWVDSVDQEDVKNAIRNDALVSGGALVSMLNGDEPKDIDVYFRNKKSLLLVAKYYAHKWNEQKAADEDYDKREIRIIDLSTVEDTTESLEQNGISYFLHELAGQDRVYARIAGHGDTNMPDVSQNNEEDEDENEQPEEKKKESSAYKPKYWSANAVSLSGKIQVILRFFGEIGQIHENYDFVHCTCSYDYGKNEVNLPADALESIINKQLIYVGSKYPLCSIFRTRKFIKRGWTVNAGQYLKMALQLNEMNLKNYYTLYDQLIGVDVHYFQSLLIQLEEYTKNGEVDTPSLVKLIDKVF